MKLLLIDDHRLDAALLERQCHELLGGVLEGFVSVDGIEAAAQLRLNDFDLVLLDPALRMGDGLAALGVAEQLGPPIIIVSQRTELAMRAFECGAVDFVPKPVARERLAKAFSRALPATLPGNTEDRRIAVRRYGRIDFVPVSDLLYAQGSDKYAELVHANGQRSLYDKCLGHLEATLPRSFVRIHKSYIVPLPMVARLIVQRGSRYSAELKTGERLPVGRSRYADVKSRLLETPLSVRRHSPHARFTAAAG